MSKISSSFSDKMSRMWHGDHSQLFWSTHKISHQLTKRSGTCTCIFLKTCWFLLLVEINISPKRYYPFRWVWPGMPKLPKITSLLFLWKILREKWMKSSFCLQINIKVFCKLISTLWASKFPTRWCYHYWWAWSSILKVLKVTTFQYLYNVSTKKLGMEFICIFCMQINIKASRSWHYRFWWKWPDLSKVSKIGSW